MKKRDSKLKRPVERFWVCFTHPEEKDAEGNYKPQGYAEISVEILPKKLAEDNQNGLGRDAPNQYPIMPEPTGRFSFVSVTYALVTSNSGHFLALEDA